MTAALTAENLAELRRLLDDMRDLATREGIYNGNRAVLDIIGRVEPLLDAAERLAQVESGADPTPFDEGTAPTPGQMWAVLLDGPEAPRLAVLAAALRAREAEVACLSGNHASLAAELAAAEVEARAQAERAVHAEKQADHETRMAVHLAGIVSGLRAKIEGLRAVHARYFDLDGRPGYDDTNPEPEDVWRFDRDFRAIDEEPQP